MLSRQALFGLESWFNRLRSILYTVGPNAFASLALLNRKWRRIADSPPLYAYHLSRCSSYVITPDRGLYSESLESLKGKFLDEVRRNTFDAFLRPRRTLIKLLSTSMSSSTASPQGEAFRFSFSVSGHIILCLSSSRIVVLDVSTMSPVVRHELKTWRRPLDATIMDDGSLLAVISSKHQINIYSLTDRESQLIQCLALNDTPRALALSPTGGVIGIAYDDRIEVQAVGEGVLTTDRRAVRCSGIDSLAFSSDGFLLLGSSSSSRNGTVVSIAVPFFAETDDGTSPSDAQVQMWTTQILFPNILRGYSRACLLPLHGDGEDDWVLGYEAQNKAFRAVRISNTNSGTIYFEGPTVYGHRSREASPSMFPTVNDKGDLAALGYQDGGIWVYGIPSRVDTPPSGSTDGAISPAQESNAPSVPSNHELCQSNIIISGHKLSDIEGISAARWIRYSQDPREREPRDLRLVAVAPGGVQPPTIGEEDVPVDGGRVLLLDFGRSPADGDTAEYSIELGEAEPKMLREPNSSLDTEIELERRRTRVNRGARHSRGASRVSYPAGAASVTAVPKPPARSRRNSSLRSGSSSNTGTNSTSAFAESPYLNAQPRSRDTLQRAATAAATTRGRHAASRLEQATTRGPQRFIPHIPHESDADNWVPPPPPYTREPEIPLPEHLRRTLLPQEGSATTQDTPRRMRRSFSTRLEEIPQETDQSPGRPALQRLNTIAGSRLAARMRRSVRTPAEEPPQTERTVLRRARVSGVAGLSPQSPGQSEIPQQGVQGVQGPRFQSPITPMETPISMFQSPVQATSSPLTPPETPAALSSSSPRHLSSPSNHTDHVVGQAMASNLMDVQPTVPESRVIDPPPTLDNYPFSFSSPNLRAADSNPNPNTPETGTVDPLPIPTERRTWYQRVPPSGRSQSQDFQTTTTTYAIPGIPPLNRRVSTDPTLSNRTPSVAAANENWRRRIEDWNERTIHETSKKNRTKCVIM